MSISWFCVWEAPKGIEKPKLDSYDLNGLHALLRGCPQLVKGHILTPAEAHDPFYADTSEASPPLIVQLEFNQVADLESALKQGGYLSSLLDPVQLPSMRGAPPAQQAMLARRYPVAEPTLASGDGSSLTYWVEYAGPAEDENAWLEFYVAHHPQLLAKFPGIRQFEIYTPATTICGLPIPVRPCMQRNKTVFDSALAMNIAMQSPVRAALREDFHRLPPFKGEALHYPYRTVSFTGYQP